MGRGALIEAPSGVTVELIERREYISMVYQLGVNGERIKERKINGTLGYLKGIIRNERI